jgi:hypothetical protein
MKTGDLARFLSQTLHRPPGTVSDYIVALMSAGLVSKGGRGRYSGADLDERDCINATLALALRHARGDCPSIAVRRVRNLMHDEAPIALPSNFAQGLTCFRSVTAGEMLENVVRDLRFGRFETWANGEEYDFRITLFDDGSSVFMSLNKKQRHEPHDRQATQGYAVPGFVNRKRFVERQISFGAEWFRQLASALGPP